MKEIRMQFSHRKYVSDYMRIAVSRVLTHFGGEMHGRKVLDVPAGIGWVGEELARAGADSVLGDINDEKPTFTRVDLEQPLPFSDDHFDAVVCCEGIEHVYSPWHLMSEFARVLRPGGILVVTTPNVQNLLSRLKFLFCGYFYQFEPFSKIPKQMGDKGHISPVSYWQLDYYSTTLGLEVRCPTGGRLKRLILFPLLMPALAVGALWSIYDARRFGKSNQLNSMRIVRHMFRLRVLMSRSLIFVAEAPALGEQSLYDDSKGR
ncbi:MAG: class I SAM-dependent methyltransferase [Gammaproteobacteria bacterium]